MMIIDKSKIKSRAKTTGYADRLEVKHFSEPSYQGKAKTTATVLAFGKKNSLEPTKLWDGYVLGLNKLTGGKEDAPMFSHSENSITTEIESWLKKSHPEFDPQDFAYSMVSKWTDVRDYISDAIEGFEPIKAVPTIYTFRWYFNQLVECYKQFLAHNRSTMFIYGIPLIEHTEQKYKSPPKEEIVTKEEALEGLIENMRKKMLK